MNPERGNNAEFGDVDLISALDRCAFDEGKRFSDAVRAERVRAGLYEPRRKISVDLGGNAVKKSPDVAKRGSSPEKNRTK